MRRRSRGTYPPGWREMARQIKEAAGWKCVRCGAAHDPKQGYCLTVHHLDLDPGNCEWWNCPALCQRCHLSIQGRVIMERYWLLEHSEWFKPYVAAYYAHLAGESTEREYIEANLERLLQLGRGLTDTPNGTESGTFCN